MRTHIFNVEVKYFLHECGSHSDNHDVAPVLTEWPDHYHPDIPKIISISRISKTQSVVCIASSPCILSYVLSADILYVFADIFPNLSNSFAKSSCLQACLLTYMPYNISFLIISKIWPHLFLSISRRRRKTLPLSSFSLLTGSKDRLERIKSFS